MPNAHSENFDLVTLGQPVTSENTEFQTFLGVIQTAGTGSPGLFNLGCQIDHADPVQGGGWYDQSAFDPDGTGTNRRIVVTFYIRADEVPATNPLVFTWLSEATTDLVPPIDALWIETDLALSGAGVDTVIGNDVLPNGGWARVVWGLYEITGSDDLTTSVLIWSGDTLHSNDPALAQGQLTGTIIGGLPKILAQCWLVFGRHGDYDQPTAGAVTLDNIGVDGNAWPVPEVQPEPGFFVVRDSVSDPLPRAEILGEWDGASSYDEVEYLGRWNGEDGYTDIVDLVDTFWLEPWAVNGAVGAPWTKTGAGTPTVTDGVVTGADPWVISRPGPTANIHASVKIIHRDWLKFRVRWDAATGDGLELVDSGGSYTLMAYSGGGTPRVLGASLSAETGITFTIRLAGTRVELHVNGVMVISNVLTPTEIGDLGSAVQIAYDHGLADGSLELGAVRTEVL